MLSQISRKKDHLVYYIIKLENELFMFGRGQRSLNYKADSSRLLCMTYNFQLQNLQKSARKQKLEKW